MGSSGKGTRRSGSLAELGNSRLMNAPGKKRSVRDLEVYACMYVCM